MLRNALSLLRRMFSLLGIGAEARDGEIYIFYNAKQHPISLDQVLQTLEKELPYKCSKSVWEIWETRFPVVRVETTLPVMILIDAVQEVVDEMSFFADKRSLSDEEVEFVKNCTARLQICGAGNPTTMKIATGTLIREPKYAPSAKDTLEVVRILMSSVDGIAFCTTDASWIRK